MTTELKNMSVRRLRHHVAGQLVELSEWDPDGEVSAVAAVEVLRRRTVRILAGITAAVGRLLDEHPDA